MDKDRNMMDRIGGQVMRLNPPMMQKTSREVRGGDSEAAQNMRMKNDGFIWYLMRNRIS